MSDDYKNRLLPRIFRRISSSVEEEARQAEARREAARKKAERLEAVTREEVPREAAERQAEEEVNRSEEGYKEPTVEGSKQGGEPKSKWGGGLQRSRVILQGIFSPSLEEILLYQEERTQEETHILFY